ncbi:unnamed protein product [Lasius platythorax]|uniref:Uncharacterized protein n=1 Tax=Lasius platythorax TaxID=488582 RepID=A0AAV2NKJ2_9HYME
MTDLRTEVENEGKSRMEQDEQGEEISARCGVRAARVAHAASTKGMKKGEGNRENQKGDTCRHRERDSYDRENRQHQAKKKDAACEGSRRESRREKEIDCSRDARAARAAL